MRGQGYDGAPAMSGKFKGLQNLIRQHNPLAFYIHCASHSLNLALSDASEVQEIQNCFDLIKKIWYFFQSPVRQNKLESCIQEIYPESKKTKLVQMCATRWVERHDAVFVMCDLFEAVVTTLDELSHSNNYKTASDSRIILCSMKESKFLVSLITTEKLLSYTLKLSKKLQTVYSDLFYAVTHAESVVNRIKELRKDSVKEFNILFDEVVKKAEFLKCNVQLPRRVGSFRNNVEAVNEEEYFRRSIFIPYVDYLISAITERLLSHKNLFKNFSILLMLPDNFIKIINPSSKKKISKKKIKQETEKSFLELVETYKEDLLTDNYKILIAELELWHKNLKKYSKLPKNAIHVLNLCKKDAFPNIEILLRIFVTLPVTTCTAERSFSTLRFVKPFLRSTMGECRLNGLASLYIHRDIFIEPEEVILIFKQNPRRLDFNL